MNEPAGHGPDLPTLFRLFRPGDDIPDYEIITEDEMPSPYHGLLVHEHHMTVTVEAHHGDLVKVNVLDLRQDDDYYARKILLTLQQSGCVVQFGIVRVNLAYCSKAVREEIVAAKTPFGRILIQHNVMRRIEPTAYLRITPGPAMMSWFNMTEPKTVYGRLALIHCDGKPAVELLEVVAPESS